MNIHDALIDEQSSAWTRFLGSHLPHRTLDLRFSLLAPHRRGTRPELSPQRLSEMLAQSRQNPRALMATIIDHTRAVNRYRMPPKPRFELAEITLTILTAAAREQVTEILKGRGGIPEKAGHRDLLDAINYAIQAQIIAYQLVFKSDYDKGKFWYMRARHRIHLAAHRIMELIGHLQQVRALRYQTLDDAHWRIANTLYCVMFEYEQVDIPLATQGPLLGTRHGRDPRSLRDLYAALQTAWILDFLAWPEALLPFVLDYCRSINEGIRILPTNGAQCGPGQAQAYCFLEGEPIRGRDGSQQGHTQSPLPNVGPPLLIDFKNLLEQAQLDFQELRKARTTRNPYLLPRSFAKIDPRLQLAVGHRMVRLLKDANPKNNMQPNTGADSDLRIHAGFAEIYAHLKSIFSPDAQEASKRRLSNLFSQRSAAIGEDHTATEQSRWHIIERAPGRLRLRTQETRYTNRLAIGVFLAFGEGEAGISEPALGQVTRIYRPEPGVVMMDLMAFADYARPVAVRRAEGPSPDEKAVKALLVFDDDSAWSLLLPDHQRFWEQTPLLIGVGNKTMRLQLGALRDLGENYCLFKLRAKVSAGKRPRYPGSSQGMMANSLMLDPQTTYIASGES